MGRVLLGGLLFLALGLSRAAAEDPGQEGGHRPVYKGSVHQEGKEEVKTFDLAKEEQAEELIAGLKNGEVDHLTLEKHTSFMDQAADLGVWTLVVFGLLLLLMWKYAWKPILQGLHKREETIHNAIAEAERARDEAQQVRAQLQQKMDQASETVRQIHEEARRRAQQNVDELIAKARADIQAERDRLRREIETARDQALQQLWNQSAQLAALIATKTIRRQLNPDDQRRLVDEALADLRRAGAERQRELSSV